MKKPNLPVVAGVLFSSIFAPAYSQTTQNQIDVPIDDYQSMAVIRADASIEELVEEGNRLFSQGDKAGALRVFEELLFLRKHSIGEDHPDTLDNMNINAFLLRDLGKFDDSIQMFENLIELQRRVFGPSHLKTARTLNNYGTLLLDLHFNWKAHLLLDEAVPLYRELLGAQHPNTLTSIHNYALALTRLGRFEEAESIAAELLRLRNESLGERHPETLSSLNLYARILGDLGRFEEAEKASFEAFWLTRRVLGKNHNLTVQRLNNYAFALQENGKLDEAEPILEEILLFRIERFGPEHQDTITSMNNYGGILLDLGRTSEALSQFSEARSVAADLFGASSAIYRRSNLNYVLALLEIGESDKALPPLLRMASGARSRSWRLFEAGVGGTAQILRERIEHQELEKVLSDVLWADYTNGANSKDFSLNQAFDSLQIAAQGSTSQAVKEAAARRLAIRLGHEDLIRARDALKQEWKDAEAGVAASIANVDNEGLAQRGVRDRRERIETKIERIDAQIASRIPEYSNILKYSRVDAGRLRNVLDRDEAVLMLVPTERGTHSFVVTKDTIEWSRADIHEDELAKQITTFRQGMEITPGGGLPMFDFDLAHNLYAELIAPIDRALNGKKRVYVVADGALSRIPLGTLTTARLIERETVESSARAPNTSEQVQRATVFGGGEFTETKTNDPADFLRAKWLADRYALVQLPSLQSLVYIRTYGSEDAGVLDGAGYTGFGDPVLADHSSLRGAHTATTNPVDAARVLGKTSIASGTTLMDPIALRRLSSLPGTRTELETVQSLLGASRDEIYLGEAMTEEAIRTADLSETRILHLATHGLTSEEGGMLGEIAEPGLVFTPPNESQEGNDGYLAASEVVGLDLTFAEWVILSACNTAAPSGKPGETGLSGLAQAFFYAGAKSLLVSHWPVYDHIAPILTAETLKRAQQQPRAEAFQAAMKEVRQTNPHPAAWAPFVLVGEGR